MKGCIVTLCEEGERHTQTDRRTRGQRWGHSFTSALMMFYLGGYVIIFMY